jgi:hypothetical protein
MIGMGLLLMDVVLGAVNISVERDRMGRMNTFMARVLQDSSDVSLIRGMGNEPIPCNSIIHAICHCVHRFKLSPHVDESARVC